MNKDKQLGYQPVRSSVFDRPESTNARFLLISAVSVLIGLNLPSLTSSFDRSSEASFRQKPAEGLTKNGADFGPYMADLQHRIKRFWFPPKQSESKKTVVLFKVDREGQLSDLQVDKSSGTKECDLAAMRAVVNAAPFRPLPAGPDKDVDIQFSFDYNVH